MTSSELPLRCQCRRHAVTSLRCARCSVAICPDCSVIAPAGMLCHSCANGRMGERFQIERHKFVPVVLATLVTAVVLGWVLVGVFRGFGFFGFLAAYFYGMTVAEVALRTSGRKRGTAMEILATACAVVGIVAQYLPIIGSVPGSAVIAFLFQPMNLLQLAIGGWAAFSRIRYL